jgi:hypothetical protein
LGGPKYAGYILTTAKNFEYIIVFCCAILFLLITVFVTLRQTKKLPKSYIVEVFDIYGQKATPDGLRLAFKTHDVAEKYGRLDDDETGKCYKNSDIKTCPDGIHSECPPAYPTSTMSS